MARDQTKAVYKGPEKLKNIKYKILKIMQEKTGNKQERVNIHGHVAIGE